MPKMMIKFDDLRRYCENHHCGSVPLEYIKQMRTVEAEPVRHGRWILERMPDGTPYCLHCSECDLDFAVMYTVVATDYCPDCGAKMETDRIFEREVCEDG